MTHPTPIPPPADAELRTSRPTARPPHPDDPRIGIAANAIGWELHRRDRDVTEHGDGNAQITITAAEAATDRAIAERVIAHLDGYGAETTVTGELDVMATGLDPEQEIRARALTAAVELWPRVGTSAFFWASVDQFERYIRHGNRPDRTVVCLCTEQERTDQRWRSDCPAHGARTEAS